MVTLRIKGHFAPAVASLPEQGVDFHREILHSGNMNAESYASVPDGAQTVKAAPIPDTEVAKRKTAKAKRTPPTPEADVLRRLGARVVRIRSRPSNAVSGEGTRVWRRNLGHGQLFVTGGVALQAILQLSVPIEELLRRDPLSDPKEIIELLRLQKDFNHQLLESGKAQLRASSEQAGVLPTPSCSSLPLKA